MLNTCPVSLRNGRFLSRHNAVLREIISRLRMANKEKDNFHLWADLEGENKNEDFPEGFPLIHVRKYIPDIMMTFSEGEAEKLVIIELTCPYEDKNGAERAHLRKEKKYQALVDEIRIKKHYDEIELHCIEIGSRGHIANTLNGIQKYLQCPRGTKTVRNFLMELGRVSLLRSMEIYRLKDATLAL